MSYKAILVHAESNLSAAPRLDAAAALAKDHDATLIGVGAEMFDWIGVSDPYGIMAADWMSVMRDQMEVDLAAAKARFVKAAGEVSHEWVELMMPPVPALAALARAADLIVAGGAPLNDNAAERTASAADLVMRCGRPVLVAPPGGGHLKGRNIVVAWKDSRESRRALTDALPLLKRAETVLILAICGKDGLPDGEAEVADVARHLQRHGIAAKTRTKVAEPSRVAMELNIAAQGIDADLIVCGAYGHNRLQEWVLGGVTYDLLHQPERFVLFSH